MLDELCASCHEVRHFLTFVADDEIKKIEQGSYLRHGIISSNGETDPIQEGADNFDINTETMHMHQHSEQDLHVSLNS
jgi:hypothetical protein